MPYKNPMNCMYPGCPNKVYKGRYCEIHRINTQQFRRGKDWEQLRQQVLEENPYCRCDAIATDVHHIISIDKGGTNNINNLESLCHACHSKITRTETMR